MPSNILQPPFSFPTYYPVNSPSYHTSTTYLYPLGASNQRGSFTNTPDFRAQMRAILPLIRDSVPGATKLAIRFGRRLVTPLVWVTYIYPQLTSAVLRLSLPILSIHLFSLYIDSICISIRPIHLYYQRICLIIYVNPSHINM